MDMTTSQYQFRAGDDVLASDGEKIGSIATIGANYLLVEKGFFFVKDYYIPFGAVTSYDEGGGKVYLSVTKDEAISSGWDEMPSGDAGSYDTGVESQDRGLIGTDVAAPLSTDTMAAGAAGSSGATGDFRAMSEVDAAATDTTRNRSRTDSDDHITVPVHEEELRATKTMREAGDVKINKRVVSEEQTMDVPVTEERVHVTRRTVDRDSTTGEDVFQEETIDVPLRAEEVNLETRTRVAEEIDIDKDAVQRTERVTGTVRKEVVDVDEMNADPTTRDRDMGRDPGAQ